MSNKIYEMVTDEIVKQLEAGVVPWRQPWTNNGAVNWKTQKSYRGVNIFLLPPGEYATFKQIQEAGSKVKKGQKSRFVVFWKWLEVEDENEEMRKIPLLRYYQVFEINTQCEGLESKRKDTRFEHSPIEEAEMVMQAYADCPKLQFESGSAWYRPSADIISVRPIADYKNLHEYYSTLFHEAIHSTGHTKRLNREGVTQAIAFGSENYSKEELVAELGAAMLCGVSGIDNHTIQNSASYIASWLRALKDDKTLLVKAAGQAQKAADYILGVKQEEFA